MKQKLIDYLNEFVKVFDSDYSVKQGEEFEALLDEETIVYMEWMKATFTF